MIIDKIKDIAASEDVPVLGFGPASALAEEPPGYRPNDLLPGAKSLICFGIPVPLGVYRPFPFGAETVWRSQALYYRRLDTLSVRFAALLEDNGAQAVPIFGCMPMALNGQGDVAGYLNQLRMGEATGIGVIGRNGLLLHSRYGARLMLGGVVTTADLPAFRMPDVDEPGCPPGCRICLDACPIQAISAEQKRVNIMRCLGYTAQTPSMPKLKFLVLRAFRPQSAARLMNQTALDEHTLHICSKCVALCPYGQAD
jgi:epoxyqueuosine reductase QueG